MTYIEKVLHCPVVIQEYTTSKKLPPVISNNYKLKTVVIDGRNASLLNHLRISAFLRSENNRKYWKI